MRRVFVPLAAVVVLALPAASDAATTAVTIKATSFSPRSITINFGDTVKWTNGDKVNHQIVANNGAFASGTLKPGQSYSFTFKTSGAYSYRDALHPSITGAVYVHGPPPAVTLATNNALITYGDTPTLSGTVSNAKAGEQVLVDATPYGSSAQQVATLVTGAGGAFTYVVTPTILTTYTVHWKTATSQPITVQVRPRLTMTRTGRTRLFAHIKATPSFAAHTIYLQRLSKFGQWVTVEKLKLGPNSGRIFTAPHKKGTFTYRAYMTTNQAGVGYLETWSNSVRVRYRH
jgi:plastocyanin